MSEAKFFQGEFTKANTALGIVYGWAIVCTKNGKPYFDRAGDHIPEDEMEKSAAEFMASSMSMGVNHQKRDTTTLDRGTVFVKSSAQRMGTIVFAWPVTAEIAKKFGMSVAKTGLLVAAKPDDQKVVDRVSKGELTAFSIGGYRGDDEVVEE